jgi:phosphoribosylformylglycinamidine synthase subunit PurS
MWHVKIQVTLRKSVLDPQGVTVEKSLAALGYTNVGDVRVGKYMEFTLQDVSREAGEAQVKEMCQRLLVNPVIEDYTFELVEVRK